jgi:hypothetical protein
MQWPDWYQETGKPASGLVECKNIPGKRSHEICDMGFV